MKKLFAILSTVAIAVAALVSCNNKEEVNKLLEVALDVEEITLEVGESYTFVATFTPEAEASSLSWTSSDTSIATVENGIVKGVGAGAASITAIAKNNMVATAEVRVFGGNPTSTWSIIGTVHGSNWDKDYFMKEENGAFVIKNLPLLKAEKQAVDDNGNPKVDENEKPVMDPTLFKIRKDGAWTDNRGGADAKAFATDKAIKAVANGSNFAATADGFYDVYYYPEKEAIVILANGAAALEDKDIKDFTKE